MTFNTPYPSHLHNDTVPQHGTTLCSDYIVVHNLQRCIRDLQALDDQAITITRDPLNSACAVSSDSTDLDCEAICNVLQKHIVDVAMITQYSNTEQTRSLTHYIVDKDTITVSNLSQPL